MTQRNPLFILLAVFTLTALLTLPALAGEMTKAKVLQVGDGDSIVVTKDGLIYRVQIAGIDAPELLQDYGREARAFVDNLVRGQKVMLEVIEETGKRAWTARVTVNGTDIAESLVEAGLAWTADGSSSAELETAQKKARSQGEGLWAHSNPTPPWQYRASA